MIDSGGLIVDTGGQLAFLPADVALSVMGATHIVPVPGLEPPAVGLTLAEDRAVAAIRIGSWPGGEMILCRVDGVLVTLVGAKVVASGRFPARQGGVAWQSRLAETLDVRPLLLRAEAAIWEARAVPEDGRRT